ncbi:aspartate/glutamate racemase family protein [Paracoccus aestuariivivens]|uniref:Arylsulfatase n=1 Tax=Paracoccus aestuariivivens TaxID=1820333 RepID=A0A6L6JD02_9RHOB|nr:aspartate/glutamate racemase family protein [Paracoccus aestuariivivens]MTH78537.1 arylsulfatase [Paracoccus aestuariivivens]
MNRPRIVLLHATPVAMEPVAQAMARLWPEAEAINLLDDSLGIDRERDGEGPLSPQIFARFDALGRYGLGLGARGILATCSAFGPALAQLDRSLPVPVVKPNEPMFRAAIGMGTRIAMLATFAPAIASMEQEFHELAASVGSDARLTTVLVSGAIEALRAGDAVTHNRLLVGAVAELRGFDAIMLAHFSTSRALADIQAAISAPVLSAPESAVAEMLARVAG